MAAIVFQGFERVDPQAIAAVILALSGLVGAPLIQVVKEALGIDGKLAVGLASLVSLLLAVVVVGVNGFFADVDFSLPEVTQAATAIFSMATLYYRLLIGDKDESDLDTGGQEG